MVKKIRKTLGRCKYWLIVFISKIYYTLFYKKNRYNILDDKKTIQKIIEEKKSLSRFGDGEFKWMLGIKQVSFQENDKTMQKRLKEVFSEENEKLIIGIPRALNNLNNLNKYAKKEWKLFIFFYYNKLKQIINKNKEYADTNITRFYMDYLDKSNCKKNLENIKKIWDKRKVVIIEGEKTKLGVGNNLLKNAISIERIIAPNKNAFQVYDDILEYASNIDKDKLILISLGPTATILASDLSKKGYQAIDIGHIDIEYEWFLMNAKEKIPVKGKYVNEAKNKGDLSDELIEDTQYKESILKIIM